MANYSLHWAWVGGEFEQSEDRMTMSRKKHDNTPVAAAAKLAHGLLGEDDAKPVSETRADWIEVLVDAPAANSRHIFSPAVGNLVCERIASGETLNKIASEPGMPSRSTISRWCTDRPEFKRQYDIAVQLRADGLLEETIQIIDDKKEIVTETTTEDEDGTTRVSKAFTIQARAEAVQRPVESVLAVSNATTFSRGRLCDHQQRQKYLVLVLVRPGFSHKRAPIVSTLWVKK